MPSPNQSSHESLNTSNKSVSTSQNEKESTQEKTQESTPIQPSVKNSISILQYLNKEISTSHEIINYNQQQVSMDNSTLLESRDISIPIVQPEQDASPGKVFPILERETTDIDGAIAELSNLNGIPNENDEGSSTANTKNVEVPSPQHRSSSDPSIQPISSCHLDSDCSLNQLLDKLRKVLTSNENESYFASRPYRSRSFSTRFNQCKVIHIQK
ncbi:hypothetical protein AVEN_58318-1 [Araneus ventricosus]|uniref:Uncharacterized protein n=1 Tax=Araneus ventricosus TaxID=182803 RepID=A0A4Y2CRQ8_ARAVE|nr:hypothetical protein AVEN_58318-1 [Araneus ventricosus]